MDMTRDSTQSLEFPQYPTSTLGDGSKSETHQIAAATYYYDLVFLVLLLYLSNVNISQFDGEVMASQNPYQPILRYGVLGFAWISLTINAASVLKDFFSLRFFAIALAWITLSLAWSVNSSSAFPVVREYMALFVCLVAVARNVSLKRSAFLVAVFCTAICALSICLALISPQYGTMAGKYSGYLRGIFAHKNTIANVAAMCLIYVWSIQYSQPTSRRLLWIMTFLVIIVLYWSGSSTSMVILALTGLCYLLLRSLKKMRGHNRTLAVILLCILIIFSSYFFGFDDVLNVLGKDASLSGRTDLWAGFMRFVWASPWLGYGFDAFGSGLMQTSQTTWGEGLTPTAHNAYIMTSLSIGVPATAIYVAFCFQRLFGAVGSFFRENDDCLVLILFSVFYLVYGLVESAACLSLSFSFLLFAFLVAQSRLADFPLRDNR